MLSLVVFFCFFCLFFLKNNLKEKEYRMVCFLLAAVGLRNYTAAGVVPCGGRKKSPRTSL